jgi:hypothetical protein
VGQVKEAVLKLICSTKFMALNQAHLFKIQNIYLENITVQDGGLYGILARVMNNLHKKCDPKCKNHQG